MSNQSVRTRFAPSPTGYLHVGGVRTALFAWLIAKQGDGQFILRLEDTDKKREVAGADAHIAESLRWVGIGWEEGFDKPGKHGSYRQSERLDRYQEWAKKLVEQGRAYADPYSAQEVQKFREEAQATKKPFLYRNHRPENPPEWDGTQPLRFKSDPKNYNWHDEVMGDLSTGPEVIDDFILVKSDGYPTYNFSHIVDDVDMEITHIIRGQEFIASTPIYLNLYEALGVTPPIMGTVPHILGPTGNKKLSKRDGAKDILDYREQGYLPAAMMNFLATLGWNDGTEQEVFTTEELISKFDMKRIQKNGSRFDETRLSWLQGAHVRKASIDELYKLVQSFWPESAEEFPDDYKRRVLALLQDRLKHFAELPALSSFFFEDLEPNLDLISSHKQLKKLPETELKSLLSEAVAMLKDNDFSENSLVAGLNELLEKTNQKPAVLFSLIRICVTWSPSSPGLAETLNLLGKDRSLKQLEHALTIPLARAHSS